MTLLAGLPIAVVMSPSFVQASTLADFGQCLAREGATFYGASWCPHCRAQRQTLGDAMPYVHYVECSVSGPNAPQAATCTDAHVTTYPTWKFSDGSVEEGEQSLMSLAAKTGCRIPASAAATAPADRQWSSGPAAPEPPAADENSHRWTSGPGDSK